MEGKMTDQEATDSRVYWQGLAEDALSILRDLEAQTPGISGRKGINLATLEVRYEELKRSDRKQRHAAERETYGVNED
jgi:hypothetical protein